MQANINTTAPLPVESGAGKPKPVKMAAKLAYRNLFHDRLSLTVTLTGIVFAVVLIAIQCGLYLGVERMIAAMLDQAEADLWIVPLGTKSFDDPTFLIGHEKYAVLSTPGVESAEELVVAFAAWRKPKGGITAVLLIGSDHMNGSLKPWNIVEGSINDLRAPSSIAVDDTYFADLGVTKIGDVAEVNNTRVTIGAVTHGIRSFTTLPYVFTSLTRARTLLDARANQATYALVRLAPGADREKVRADLTVRLKDREVLEQAEFRKRSVDYWLFGTGAGGALIAGATLGLIVGIVIVAQTLYSSTKDHLPEFATLRALGASAGYIHKVILIQALLSAVVGYGVGMILTMVIIWATQETTLTIVMTPGLALLL
ncbi:MAG: ABC transporter permease, partial [Hyphomicrobiaceae bacterium]|nr:ABC transporter permease [Hyphomicrobiaceae bacterium]